MVAFIIYLAGKIGNVNVWLQRQYHNLVGPHYRVVRIRPCTPEELARLEQR